VRFGTADLSSDGLPLTRFVRTVVTGRSHDQVSMGGPPRRISPGSAAGAACRVLPLTQRPDLREARPPRVKHAARHCPFVRLGVLGVSDHGEPADAEGAAAAPARPGTGWTLVSLPAEVDIANVDEMRADLVAAIEQGCPVVIVDMTRTSFCDCAGVGVLLAAASQALRAGLEIRIVARARTVLRTFELTGLYLVLPVYPTTGDADRGPPETAGNVLALAPATARLRRRLPADVG
jgi:anti-sigma B factor antagonist